MFDDPMIAALMPIAKRMIGSKKPQIEIVCPDKDKNGINVNGQFITFAECERQIAEF